MNRIIFSEGNIEFIESNGHVTNVHPWHVYVHFNIDTLSFVLVGLPESSGLAFMTTLAKDLEVDGQVYTFDELPMILKEKFAESGAQLRCEVVDTLPVSGRSNTIYLVPQRNEGANNVYDEYVYLKKEKRWELLGDTSIELSRYVKKTDFEAYRKYVSDTYLTKLDALGMYTQKDDFDREIGNITRNFLTKLEAQGLYQPKLVDGINIATINGMSLLGGGNIVIEGGTGGTADMSNYYTKGQVDAKLTSSLNDKLDKNGILIEGTVFVVNK